MSPSLLSALQQPTGPYGTPVFFASLTPFAANAQLAVLYFPGVLDMTKQKVAVGEENDRVGGCRGRRLNGFLGLSLNDRIVFLVILLDKRVSVG